MKFAAIVEQLEPRQFLASITGNIYHDLDGDGGIDAGDAGVQNWTVFLDQNGNGVLDVGESSTATDANGKYSFGGLSVGTHRVRALVQAGWFRTSPIAGSHLVSITSSTQSVTGKNFLNTRPGSIKGGKFEDVDGDGAKEAGDPGLADWTVYLDTNNNSVADSRSITQSSGDVFIPTLDEGTIASELSINSVAVFGRVLDVNVSLNLTHTWDADLDVYLVSPSGTRVRLFDDVGGSGNNFTNTTLDDEAATAITAGVAPFIGNFRPEQALSTFDHEKPLGTWRLEVSDDFPGETGSLDNWSITVRYGDPSTTTIAGGSYSFTNLPPGGYILRERLILAGWMRTSPPVGNPTVTVPSGGDIRDQDLLNTRLAQISGYKYEDVDGDGVQDPEDFTGLPGWTIYLDMDNDSVRDSSVTTRSSQDVSRSIAEASVITSDLVVNGLMGRIIDINVMLDITHPADADLDVFLISPNGREVELFTDVGGAGDNFDDTTLDDEAATAITAGAAPFNGTYRPEGLLSSFDSQSPNGMWKLRIGDDTGIPGFIQGTLNSWALEITHGDPWTVSSPAHTFGNLPPGSYRVREVMQPGWRQTYPAIGYHDLLLLSGGAAPGTHFMNTRQSGPISGVQRRMDSSAAAMAGGHLIDTIRDFDSANFSATRIELT
jgi:subtilisin-like proprotein convertase family protein